MKWKLVCASMVLAMSTSAIAQDTGGVTVGVTGGTLGIGPEASYRFSKSVAVRGNLTFP